MNAARRIMLALAAAVVSSAVSSAWSPRASADQPASKTAPDADTEAPVRPLMPDDGAAPPPDPLGPDATMDRWCAPDVEVLTNGVCAYTPSAEARNQPRTLVIFLHGVVKQDTTWQWTQQRGAMRAGESHGFTVIMPHGRTGIGPHGMEDWWAWPTSAGAQTAVEDELLGEWQQAQAEIETRTGRPFERVWVFGFSNGGYYATSLALRGKLENRAATLHADGFAVFAGGSGASYLEKAAKADKSPLPIFVGWGGKDPAHGDQEKLASMLHRVGWPSKGEGAKRAGHVMTDKQVTDAIRFLDDAPAAARAQLRAQPVAKEARVATKPTSHPRKKSAATASP